MTLSEFALLLDADPKWVLNARAILGRRLRYSLPVAQRLAVARALQDALGVLLPRAYAMAAEALQAHACGQERARIGDSDGGPVVAEIDVRRVLAAVNVRLSRLRTMYAPKQAGRRPRAPRNALRAAERYGVDLSLLTANLRRTPAQRLRQLDAMVEFRQRARRLPSA